jgi:hypothetical protein
VTGRRHGVMINQPGGCSTLEDANMALVVGPLYSCCNQLIHS